MVDRRTGRPPARTAGRVSLALLVLVVVLGGAPLRARAGMLSGSGGDGSFSVGNGRNNKTNISNFSPTEEHGIQHMNDTTVGGVTKAQAAFCKRKIRHCRIVQRIVEWDP